MTTVAISGNTYPVREQLKDLGGRWNAADKAWMVPAHRADAARQIVAGAPKSTGSSRSYKCKVCGHVERRDHRGYPVGDRILRSGECQSCYEERKMGY